MMTTRAALLDLARAVSFHALDEDTLAVFLRDLAEADTRDVEAACRHLARTTDWWPKLHELRAAITQAATARQRLTTDEADPRQLVRCPRCEDTGYTWHRCPGGATRTCGRDKSGFAPSADGKRMFFHGTCHYEHQFVQRCRHARP